MELREGQRGSGARATAAAMMNFQSMLKDGYKHLTGLEESVLKNIEACKQLSHITRTSLGPHGTHPHLHPRLRRLRSRRHRRARVLRSGFWGAAGAATVGVR